METKKNYYQNTEFTMYRIGDHLWISNVIEEDVCVVFQRYEGSWDHGYYTLDEIENF